MTENFWDRVEKVAKGLGATDDATRQWRHRKSVPASWHLLLFQNAHKYDVEFSLNEFTSKKRKQRKPRSKGVDTQPPAQTGQ
jgi:hypothetical protein